MFAVVALNTSVTVVPDTVKPVKVPTAVMPD